MQMEDFLRDWIKFKKAERPLINNKIKIRRKNIQYPDGATPKYKQYYKRDLDRNMLMTVEPFDFEAIIAMPCVYCGKTPCNGVDRIDSAVGYVLNNCQPCCNTCNVMKNSMSHQSFIEHINKIIKRLN